MGSFFDVVAGGDSFDDRPRLTERRLGEEPALVILFTDDAEPLGMHYAEVPEYPGYVICPGKRCPLCHIGKPAQVNAVLPVYDCEDGKVKALRVPVRKSVGSLAMQLMPLLRKQSTKPEIVRITYSQRCYTVKTLPLPETVDDGHEAIAAFLEERKQGLKLSSAFSTPTAEDLAGCDRIRRKLETLDNYFTDADRQPAADVPDPDAEGD